MEREKGVLVGLGGCREECERGGEGEKQRGGKAERTQVFIKQLPHRARLLATPCPPSPPLSPHPPRIWILFGVTLKTISLIIPELGLHDIVHAKMLGKVPEGTPNYTAQIKIW